jgi:hypothetical protein
MKIEEATRHRERADEIFRTEGRIKACSKIINDERHIREISAKHSHPIIGDIEAVVYYGKNCTSRKSIRLGTETYNAFLKFVRSEKRRLQIKLNKL